ncbi:MAG TPA: PqqD family protein [Gemmatimonadaceae bacterium]|nr:PqqD family protein [Gemmatimonadaceae bacterium]
MKERFRRSPAVEETTVGERIVLYHRVSGSAIVLNPSASLLWKELAHDRDIGELESVLAEQFPSVERSRIAADVASCLDDLGKHKLVTSAPASGSAVS